MRINLAPVAGSEREALLDLWVESWSGTFPAIDFLARRPWFEERLNDFGTRGILILGAYGLDKRLIGFVTLDQTCGEIDQLCVARPAQGSGVGKALIAAAKEASPGGLSLTVNLDNGRALRFYEREGFERGLESVNPMSGLRTVVMRWQPIQQP